VENPFSYLIPEKYSPSSTTPCKAALSSCLKHLSQMLIPQPLA
jgi:hypothetical protein